MSVAEMNPAAAAVFLRDSGLLGEINRRVLHPLGLALQLETGRPDDGGEEPLIGLGTLIRVDAPDGIVFDQDTLDDVAAKLHAFMSRDGLTRHLTRLRAVGYVEQPLPPRP